MPFEFRANDRTGSRLLKTPSMEQPTQPFWSLPVDEVVARLGSTRKGLSSAEVLARLKRYGDSRLAPKKRTDAVTLLLGQFSNPIVLMLVGAAVISMFLHDTTDAVIILVTVLASGLLSFTFVRNTRSRSSGIRTDRCAGCCCAPGNAEWHVWPIVGELVAGCMP